jgi:transaldolase
MKFFIDTADLKQIKTANQMGILDGVTTNPSLMSTVGVKGKEQILNHYLEICKIVDGPVSAEVLATDYDGMISEGKELSELHPNIVVKLPMTHDGVRAIKYLSYLNIKTNCTLIFSVGQALVAAKAGATYVSPFVGRLDDISSDGLDLIKQIKQVLDNYPKHDLGYTKILAASIRNPMHIVDCAKIGADVVTAPLSVLQSLISHPLTDSGMSKFIQDTQKFI